ncbi:MAG: TrmJ/YjtD family RNA methyltransferase [Candidatus Marsarchaeota archaeon]|jgi:TrmH family RNA methyltransferase|nr:TrmJ/YjtD family RNA methyltransferase [Candidatus Marsarchaeota archaeon]
MRIKVIIVSPKYQLNIGYIARVSKNFGVKQLCFVRPRANVKGNKSVMYAKHARDLLESAMIYNDFDSAIDDCEVVVGTTGLWRRGYHSGKIGVAERVLRQINTGKTGTLGVVIGRDDKGLTNEEIEKCDKLAFIPTSPEYPVLNISHALSIILYILKGKGLNMYETAEPEKAQKTEIEILFNSFERMIDVKKIRNKAMVLDTFKKMVRRSGLNRREIHALLVGIK